MKKTILLALSFSSVALNVLAQLDSCRPRICMVSYGYHDDNIPNNPTMTAIQAAKPDLLIENTPGGYWGQINNGTGCIPAYYTPLGIKVFSYIAGGYEGTLYNNNIDSLILNIARVTAIAQDNATGVFLDEVSAYPTAASKEYIAAIDSACDANGLMLILNPGTYNFDAWLMTHCDYIMTDENYDGQRAPTLSESPYLQQVIVIADTIHNANGASTISSGARAHCFGYSYACDTFTALPAWLNTYLSMITQPPATPVATQNDDTITSSAYCGNQWYEQSQGPIAGAVDQTYIATMPGTYFTIVTLDNCPSDTSNLVSVVTTRIGTVNEGSFFTLSPNPAKNKVTADWQSPGNDAATILIYDVTGKLVFNTKITGTNNEINFGSLQGGLYFVALVLQHSTSCGKLVIQQ